MTQFIVSVFSYRWARLLTFNDEKLLNDSMPKLGQVQEIANPIQSEQGRVLWTEIMSGRNRGVGSHAHAYDDRRDRHVNEYERRFVEAVARATLVLACKQHSRCIVLAAEPKLMSLVRRAVGPLLLKGMLVKEIVKDLDNLTLPELQQYLAQQNLLPSDAAVC